MTLPLFGDVERAPVRQELGASAALLRGLALPEAAELLGGVEDITARSPFRHMVTPGGFRMSVAMTNAGALGWVTDRTGYRYDSVDPESGACWPPIPDSFARLAASAAREVGFDSFIPDACLINRYEPGARLTLHQDRNEVDFSQPIVSVSLGLPAVFEFGGLRRKDKPVRLGLEHGDVVVWGGPDRLRYHGVLPLKDGHHPVIGPYRINLTFRKAT